MSPTMEAVLEIERLSAINAELLAALEEIETICAESNSAFRKRMGTRVGNCLTISRAVIRSAKVGRS